MKIKIFTLLFFLIAIFSIDKISAKSNLSLLGKIIVIDPGHGAEDPGASRGDILEKDINLAISLELEKELSKKGAIVIMTRDDDYDLSKPNAMWRKKSDFDNRIKLINNSGTNLYISIHLNSLLQTEYDGAQVFYNKNSEISMSIARVIQETINEELKGDRMIKRIPADTYMYSQLTPPGVLIECGFLSNYNERGKLVTSEYQKKIATAIANGVEKYI